MRVRDLGLAPEPDAVEVIKPAQLAFVSYPFEWSFSQLKASALATLQIQRQALAHGLSLKDASAYNIQLREGRALAHRLAVVRAVRAGFAVGGLSTVLPALPGAAGADGVPGRSVGSAAAGSSGRAAAGFGRAVASLAHANAARSADAPAPA